MLGNQAIIIPPTAGAAEGRRASSAELQRPQGQGPPQAGSEARRWQSGDADSPCGWKAGAGLYQVPGKDVTAGKHCGRLGAEAGPGSVPMVVYGVELHCTVGGEARGRHRGQAPRGQEGRGTTAGQRTPSRDTGRLSHAIHQPGRDTERPHGMVRNPWLSREGPGEHLIVTSLWTGSRAGGGPAQFLGENVQS